MFEKKKNLALVLSAGSAKGFAHIGALQVLEENHIPIEAIVGTSMGALVGGLYAAGTLKAFTDKAITLSDHKLVAMMLSRKIRKGKTDTEEVESFLKEFTQGKKIEDLPIAFTAVAVNLKTGKETFIESGDLLKAILASISIPGIFQPVKIGDELFVDGGVLDPLPQRYGHLIARKVISVNALPAEYKYKDEDDVFGILSEAVGIMTSEIAHLKLDTKKGNTVFIQLKTEDIASFDFSHAQDIINLGREAAEKNLKKIIELVQKP